MDKIRGPGIKKICLALLIMLGILFSTVLFVRAEVDGPGTGGEGGGVNQDNTSKWNASQVGVRFYIVDSNGNRVSKTVDVLKSMNRLDIVAEAYSSARSESLGFDAGSWTYAAYEVVSGALPGLIWPVDLGSDDVATGNGEAFKQWFLSHASNGKTNAHNWLEYNEGGNFLFTPSTGLKTNPETGEPSVLYTMQEDDLALIVEPVIWYQPASNGGVISGRIVYGSITNLLQWHAQTNWAYAKQTSGRIAGGNLYTIYKTALKGFIVGGQATSNYTFTWPSDADVPGAVELPTAFSAIQGSNTGYAIHYYNIEELMDTNGISRHKIFDLEVDLNITEDEIDGLSLQSLMSGGAEVNSTNLPIKYTIPDPPPNGYNMETKAPSRGYNPSGKYKFTLLVTTTNATSTLQYFNDGDTLLRALQNGTLSYTQKNIVNNIKNETRQDPLKKFFYINIWVTATPDLPPILQPDIPSDSISDSDGYIRKDEITAAQKAIIPGGYVAIAPTATPGSCSSGGTGHGASASTITWHEFRANFVDSGVVPHKLLHSDSAEHDKYLIVGTIQNKYRMYYGLGVNTDAMTTEQSNTTGSRIQFQMPTNSAMGFIAHRSGGNTGLRTPPLAAYMSEANATYKYYMQESGITHQEVYRPEDVTDPLYGYTEASKSYSIQFTAYADVDDHVSSASYDAYYPCGYNETRYSTSSVLGHRGGAACPTPPCTHTYDVTSSYQAWVSVAHTVTGLTSHDTSVVHAGNTENFKIGVEGTYNGRQITVPSVPREIKVFKNSGQNVADGGILVKIPVSHDFYPTYIMKADYNEQAYEDGGSYIRDREPVWVLSKQKRTLNTYNVHTISLTGATEPIVQAPWSTDKLDRDNEADSATGKPTAKAGLVVKPKAMTVEYTIKSTVWLHDTRFVKPNLRSSVEAKNQAILKEHSDIIDQFLGMGRNLRDSGRYAFGYSSIPGAYDLDMVGRGFIQLKNNFENVVNGTRKNYSDSQIGDALEQTKLTILKANATQGATSATGFYVNKIETDNDAQMSRTMTLNIPASGLASASTKNISLSVEQAGTNRGSTESGQCMTDGLIKMNTLLETGPGAHSWYKEDYEGMVCVTLTTKVTITLEGGYSVLWRALSDWRDLSPIEPYTDARPLASGSQQSIQPIISAGNAGIGYGIMTDNFSVGSHDFGQVALLWKPYLFNIRASAYDDVVR